MFLSKRSQPLYVVYVVMESFSKVCIGEKKITLQMFLSKRSQPLYVVYVVMESFSKVCM